MAAKMRQTGRGIVIRDDMILLIERHVGGVRYYSIPGGGQEPGERLEQTVKREIEEETTVVVKVERPLYEMDDPDGNLHTIFLCEYISGQPKLKHNSEEAHNMVATHGQDSYAPAWVALNELGKIPFLYWQPVGERIAADLKAGWTEDVQRLHTKTFLSYTGSTTRRHHG